MTVESTIKLARRLMANTIDYPERSIGEIRITREVQKAGTKLFINSFRSAMYGGEPICDIVLEQDYVMHEMISGEHGTWMSDRPSELVQMHRDLARYAHGRVLVGGLGLGILPRMLRGRRGVSSITVVERNPDVIALVGPHLRSKRISIIQADLHDFVADLPYNEYDTALLDTWQDTGEWVWQTEVVPLRRAIGGTITRVACWMETVMLNQVAGTLLRTAEVDPAVLFTKSTNHYYAFRRALIDQGIRTAACIDRSDTSALLESEMRNQKDQVLMSFLREYLTCVGSLYWERTFGKYWDEAWNKKKDEDAA